MAIGPPGRAAAAVAAILLTLGTTNAYLSGAAAMAMKLTRHPAGQRSPRPFLALSVGGGILVIGLYWLRIVTTVQLVALPTALFLAVYLGCTLSAARTLTGRARWAALAALPAVAALLAFCGWPAVIAAAVAAAGALRAPGTLSPPRRALRAAGTEAGNLAVLRVPVDPD